ncbi:MAG: YkvA family protein [Armatimonadota bacterium]
MASSHISTRTLFHIVGDFGALAVTPEGRQIIGTELSRAIKRSKIGEAMLDKVQIMYAYFRDPAEPVKPKLLIGGALLYLIVPTDLIPDWAPLLGFTDDLTVIMLIWRQLGDVLKHYEDRRAVRQVSETI